MSDPGDGPADSGGDAVCWLDQLCPECGAMPSAAGDDAAGHDAAGHDAAGHDAAGDRAGAVCWRCGFSRMLDGVPTARAFWTVAPGVGEIRTVDLPVAGPDDVLVRTLYTGVSRGTETLVFRGEVPESQYSVMRAPFQDGDFPAPVKYGYLAVGVVEAGPAELLGRTVFCLYPHQTRFVVPASAVVPVPDDVPAARAVLAGAVETAVNALWDAAPLVGDRIAVVGAGMIGCAVAAVLARIPGVRLELVDVAPERAEVADALGVRFVHPEQAAGGCDLVVHASATEAGLARSLELLAPEGEVVELSWYGDRAVRVPLGAAFHSGRLTVRSSQVGTVSPRRARRSYRERMMLALDLLSDPRFDALVTGECAFDELPTVLPRLAAGEPGTLCVRVVCAGGGRDDR